MTVKVKEVGFTPVAFTVTVELPVGVEDEVNIVRVVEQVGLHDPVEKLGVAPAGNPEIVKDTV